MATIPFDGLKVDPLAGRVIGAKGREIGAVCADGYVRIHCGRYAHRVVWQAVNGPIPDGLEINHINGIKTDNRVENLELATRSQNQLHAVRAGLWRPTPQPGESNPNSKLTEAEVRDIRATKGSVSLREWARRLGVDPALVSRVRLRKAWRHVV